MITTEIRNFLKESSILVTGGAGFIGSNIVHNLAGIGVKRLVVLDDLSTGFKENLQGIEEGKDFEFIQGSITDYQTCLKATEGIEVVFQLAALGSVPRSIDNPLASNEVNVTGFLNVLNAARENKVKRIVYSSSSSVYGDDTNLPKVESKTGNPLSPYAVTKVSNELYARTFSDLFDIDIVGLRYFNVFGPRQNIKGPYAAVIPIFISNLLNGEQCYINGDGNISRDFTFVQNVVEANFCAAYAKVDIPDKIFNIAMGNQLSLNELYDALESEIQSGLEPIHREQRKGDILSSLADISRAQEYLKYKPTHPLKEGLLKTINWYREKK
ncbi:MAG: NAD-dependent epimerase/dehydratase family protein [Flavobacteriales bacterium]|nr:NAD-dependent epimerase/dehydratase family protein [Flavobacteriales bacterium]